MKSKSYILFYIANALDDNNKSGAIKDNIQSCYKYSKVLDIGYIYTIKAILPSNKDKIKEVLSELAYDNILRAEFWINGKCVASPVDSLQEFLENVSNIKKQFTDGKQ